MFSYGLLVLGICTLAGAYPSLLDNRIVGGREVDIEQFPHQLSLQLNGRHICGASIISSKWALTAAHCMISNNTEEYTFRAGSSLKRVGGVVHRVEVIVKHPNYNPKTKNMDFTLMKVVRPFQVNTPGIKAIKMAEAEPATDTGCTVSGWGALGEEQPSPEHLMAVDVVVYDRKKCNTEYLVIGGITENMFCAKNPNKDSCQGDSGGPLINDKTGELVGVVSFGIGCANPRFAGVYGNVAKVRSWIKEVANV